VGIEEELLLVDGRSYVPAPVAQEVIETGLGRLPSTARLEFEAKREQIEVVSLPQRTHTDITNAVLMGRSLADAAARAVGARAVAVATSPVLCESHLVSTPRYDLMSERFGLTMTEQLTCGFHVHVTVASAAEGVAVLDRIRPWLPVLLALSANSPYWRAADSGYASYRYQAWGRWPGAGPYDLFESPEGYAATVDRTVRSGVSLDSGMIYFDARLSSHAPTVEVRIADVCLLPEDAATIATLTRALVEAAAWQWRHGIAPVAVSTGLLRLASWRASRSGLEESLAHPVRGLPCPASEIVALLLEHVASHYIDAEEALAVQRGVAEILRRGTGAVMQRDAGSSGSLTDVLADAATRTHTFPPAASPAGRSMADSSATLAAVRA
jgi:glutamate---cysteine ligase / carboxylate-amine ligase